MKKIIIIIAVIVVLCFLFPYVVNYFGTTNLGAKILTLGTTTSIENSGLLSYLNPKFQEKTGIKIMVVAKVPGAILQLARKGNVDAVLLNSEDMEKEFVAENNGIDRTKVMYNVSAINDPQKDKTGKNIKDLFHIIAVNPSEQPQVSYANTTKYIKWITSVEVQGLIGQYKKNGKQPFQPAMEKK